MKRVECWPPPKDWAPVVLSWQDIFDNNLDIQYILDWVGTAPGGNYHLHGWNGLEGFEFRFEDHQDASFFALNVG